MNIAYLFNMLNSKFTLFISNLLIIYFLQTYILLRFTSVYNWALVPAITFNLPSNYKIFS